MNIIQNEILKNPILRSVQEKFENQTVKGLAKYGETVNPDYLTTEQWINHAIEEAIDFTVYLSVLKHKLSESEYMRLYRENERMERALEYYADVENYEDLGHGESAINYDGGENARKALEGTK